MKVEAKPKVEARVTLTIGGQKFELSMKEAEELLSELRKVCEKQVVFPPAPAIPWDKLNEPPYRPQPPHWRDNEITCRSLA